MARNSAKQLRMLSEKTSLRSVVSAASSCYSTGSPISDEGVSAFFGCWNNRVKQEDGHWTSGSEA
jgi:hypothetical protein